MGKTLKAGAPDNPARDAGPIGRGFAGGIGPDPGHRAVDFPAPPAQL